MGSDAAQWPQEALRWMTDPQMATVLSDVLAWCRTKDTSLRSTDIYIETKLADSGRTGPQVDLVIAFETRLIACEFKFSPDGTKARTGLVSHRLQTERQVNALEASAKRAGAIRATAAVLCYPFIPAPVVKELDANTQNAAKPFMGIAGGLKCKREAPSLYLPAVLERLFNRSNSNSNPCRTALRADIEALNQPHLQVLPTIPAAVDYLKRLDAAGDHAFPSDQRDGLRPTEIKLAADILASGCFLEVVGARMAGKTRFIDELIRTNLKNRRVVRHTPTATSAAAFYADVLDEAGRALDSINPREYWKACAELDIIIWLPTVGEGARRMVQDLARDTSSKAKAGRAKWIVESRIPISGAASRVELSAVSDATIRELLLTVEPGRPDHDLNRIAMVSRGNPGIAVALWESTELLAPGDLQGRQHEEDLAWLQQALGASNFRVLTVVVFALSQTPCGLSVGALSHVVRIVLNDLMPSNAQTSTQRVVDTLEKHQLVHVYRVRPDLLPSDLARMAFVAVNNLSTALVHFIDSKLALQRETLKRRVSAALASLDSEQAQVARQFLQGDLAGFYWTTFRSTHRAQVVRWLDSTLLVGERGVDVYSARALRVGDAFTHDNGHAPRLEVDLGLPQTEDEEAIYQHIRFATSDKLRLSIPELRTLLHEASSIESPGIRLPALAYVGRQLASAGNSVEGWNAIEVALKGRHSLRTSDRARLLRSVLGFLNATRLTGELAKRGNKTPFAALWRTSATELLRIGIETQNISLVADGFFYLARCDSHYSNANVDIDTAASRLRFVANVSPQRALQAVLTEGSLHRRAVRDNMVEDGDIDRHLRHAALLFEQTVRTARALDLPSHRLNAVSYLGEVVQLAIEKGDSLADPAIWLEPTARQALAVSLEVLSLIERERNPTNWVVIPLGAVQCRQLLGSVPAGEDAAVSSAAELAVDLLGLADRGTRARKLGQWLRAMKILEARGKLTMAQWQLHRSTRLVLQAVSNNAASWLHQPERDILTSLLRG